MRKITRYLTPTKPVIKSFDCTDHDPISAWVPDDPADVDFGMNFSIGLPDETGADNFQVHVVTHEALKHLRGAENRKYLLVLHEYSWPAVLAAVDAVLEECRGYDWSDMAEKLRLHFFWEYEGYKG